MPVIEDHQALRATYRPICRWSIRTN